jgi:hypothetical protein
LKFLLHFVSAFFWKPFCPGDCCILSVSLVSSNLVQPLGVTVLIIPIRGHEGLQGCEISRLPLFLHSWHTCGSEDFSLMLRLAAPYNQEHSW